MRSTQRPSSIGARSGVAASTLTRSPRSASRFLSAGTRRPSARARDVVHGFMSHSAEAGQGTLAHDYALDSGVVHPHQLRLRSFDFACAGKDGTKSPLHVLVVEQRRVHCRLHRRSHCE
eukprot:Amastigsp_a686359_55.p1 type:complete len:119 gc:universal Amastigsp_a686359_55:31-387(+)